MESNTNKVWLFTALIAVGLYLLYKRFSKRDELQDHLMEQNELQKVGAVASTSANIAWEQYPLSTVGDTPLAGVHTDPFNPDNPASQPKDLQLYPSQPHTEGGFLAGAVSGIKGAFGSLFGQ